MPGAENFEKKCAKILSKSNRHLQASDGKCLLKIIQIRNDHLSLILFRGKYKGVGNENANNTNEREENNSVKQCARSSFHYLLPQMRLSLVQIHQELVELYVTFVYRRDF